MDLSAWIDRHARLTPGRTAICFPGRDVSYGALAELVHRLASAMAASGLKRGSCAAYLGVNSPEMLALLFACARLGVLFMPLNWRLAGPEHRHMLEQCPPSLLFVEPHHRSDVFKAPCLLTAVSARRSRLACHDDFSRAPRPAWHDPISIR
jgi:fatty-acyl-CoA synthase